MYQRPSPAAIFVGRSVREKCTVVVCTVVASSRGLCILCEKTHPHAVSSIIVADSKHLRIFDRIELVPQQILRFPVGLVEETLQLMEPPAAMRDKAESGDHPALLSLADAVTWASTPWTRNGGTELPIIS